MTTYEVRAIRSTTQEATFYLEVDDDADPAGIDRAYVNAAINRAEPYDKDTIDAEAWIAEAWETE